MKFLVKYTHVKHVEIIALVEATDETKARECVHSGEIIEEFEDREDWWEVVPRSATQISEERAQEWLKKNHDKIYETE